MPGAGFLPKGPRMLYDFTTLEQILSGLPDQIMGVLLAYLTFKTFLDLIK